MFFGEFGLENDTDFGRQADLLMKSGDVEILNIEGKADDNIAPNYGRRVDNVHERAKYGGAYQLRGNVFSVHGSQAIAFFVFFSDIKQYLYSPQGLILEYQESIYRHMKELRTKKMTAPEGSGNPKRKQEQELGYTRKTRRADEDEKESEDTEEEDGRCTPPRMKELGDNTVFSPKKIEEKVVIIITRAVFKMFCQNVG
ncbi:hypothetical protein BGX27_000371 [Mortierella sp. AM989]|nr:hypothetical protein BGX27_000371 [Mortierella sp. AM989]